MRSRSGVLVLAIMALVASMLLVAPAAATGHGPDCDRDYVKVHGNVIKVLPTGMDDTENLQCALDLAASMPWAKVVLKDATYHTSFLEVEGFHGVFKGQGKHKTTIATLPDGLDCIARMDAVGDPFLLTFAASNVTMKGITFAVGGAAPCAEPWDEFVDDEGYGYAESSIGAVFATGHLAPGEACPATVDHRFRAYGIGIVSELPDFEAMVFESNGYFAGITVAPRWMDEPDCGRLRGDVVVRGSHISGAIVAVRVWSVDDSTILIGGKKAWQPNTYTNIANGFSYRDTTGTRVYMRGNQMHDVLFYGVNAQADDLGGAPNTMVIADNTISGDILGYAVGLFDWGPYEAGRQMLLSTVTGNTIEMDGTFGILAIGSDGKIVRNHLSGYAWAGIALDGIWEWDEETDEAFLLAASSGWFIARNKLKALETEWSDIDLTDGTADNTVICKCRHDTVVDEGVDNLIVRCNVIEPPPEEEEFGPDAASMSVAPELHPAVTRLLER